MLSTVLVPILVLLCLALFGLIYNAHIARMEAKGIEGETWLWVVIGVGVTVLSSGFLIGWINVLWMLAAFAASGAAMIVGARSRHSKKVKRFDRRITDHAEQTPPAR